MLNIYNYPLSRDNYSYNNINSNHMARAPDEIKEASCTQGSSVPFCESNY